MNPLDQNKKVKQNQEAEKSTFEKFEDEVKTTIFNVLYVLLKDDETAHWKHIAMVLSDFIQIWYFSFAAGVKFYTF